MVRVNVQYWPGLSWIVHAHGIGWATINSYHKPPPTISTILYWHFRLTTKSMYPNMSLAKALFIRVATRGNNSTWPLDEPVLTCHQRCFVTFTRSSSFHLEQFFLNFIRAHELNLWHLFGDYTFEIMGTFKGLQKYPWSHDQFDGMTTSISRYMYHINLLWPGATIWLTRSV